MHVQKRLSYIVVIAFIFQLFTYSAPGQASANGEGNLVNAAADFGYVVSDFENIVDKWNYSFGDQPTVEGSFKVVETDEAYAGQRAGQLNADFRTSVSGKPAFVAMRKDLEELDVRGLSFWVKTSEVKYLGVRSTDSTGQVFQQHINLQNTPEWQQVVVSPLTASLHWGGANDGVWHEPARSMAILLDRGGIKNGAKTASMLVDQVTAQLGDWQPELKIRQNALGNVFLDNEPVSFRISTKYPLFQWSVYDLNGSVAAEGTGQAPDGNGMLEMPGMAPGYYVLRVTVQQDNGEELSRLTPFATLTDYDWDVVEDSPFGIAAHLHRTSFGWSEDLAQLIRHAGAKTARGGMEWTIEKAPGEYKFSPQPDLFMDRLKDEGLKGMFVSGYNNSLYDNNATPYTDAGREGFANYVNAYVSRYKDQLVGVQVYNEFNGGFGKRGNSPADSQPSYYYELLKKTYETVKANHPDFTVSGMVTAGIPLSWMEQVFQLGGMNYLDNIAVHPYRYGRMPVEARAPEGLGDELEGLKNLIRQYNGGELKPIWISEIGWPTHQASNGTDEKTQADYLVRAYVVALSHGVEKMVWYNLMNDGLQSDYNEHNFGLIRYKEDPLGAYTPKPSYVSYAAMSRQLTGAVFQEEEDYGAGLKSYLFDRDGEEIRVIWSLGEKNAALLTNEPLVITDLTGKEETFVPHNGKVYVTLNGEPLYVKGGMEGIEEDATFALIGEETFAGEEAGFTVRLDNTISAAAAAFTLEVEGERYDLSAQGGQTAEMRLTLPEYELKGFRSAVITVMNGDQKIGKLRHHVVYETANETKVRPLMELEDGQYRQSLAVEVSNFSKTRALQVKQVEWKVGSQTGVVPWTASVPPESAERLIIPLNQIAFGQNHSALVRVDFQDRDSYKYEGPLGFNPITRGTIDINNEVEPDLEEQTPVIDLSQGKAILLAGHTGSIDVSGKMWMHYDKDHFYLTAKVTDNVHAVPASGANIWNNDGIQFAMSYGIPGESQSWYEYGVADTPNGAQVYRWNAAGGNPTGAVSNAEAEVTRLEEQGLTIYKLALPWSELAPVKPYVGEMMSFSLLVNDNDGNGRRGWKEWGSGIGLEKRPSLFRSMQWILPVYEPEIHVNGIAEEESYTDEVTPVVSLADESGEWQLKRMELNGEEWLNGTAVTEQGNHSLRSWAESVYGQQMSKTITFKVFHSTALEVKDDQGAYGNTVQLEAVLKDAYDQPVSGEQIVFEVDGVPVGMAATNEEGVATMPYTVDSGIVDGAEGLTLEVKAVYAGNEANFIRGSEAVAALTIAKGEVSLQYSGILVAPAGENVVLSAQLVRNESAANGMLEGLPIAFELSIIQPDGALIPLDVAALPQIVLTDANGNVSISRSLPAGLYEVRTKLLANDYYQISETVIHLAVYDAGSGSIELNGHIDLTGDSSFMGNKAKKAHINVGQDHVRIHATPQGLDWTFDELDWEIVTEQGAYLQGEVSHGGEIFTVRLMIQAAAPGDQGKASISLLVWEGRDTAADPVFAAFNSDLKGSFRIK